jgi:hypothetical protein
MIKDKEIIQKELTNHVEISFPFELPQNIHIKYITYKNNSEYFFKGGKFINKINDSIKLQNNGRSWNVPINIRNKEGEIIYKSRFFIGENSLNDSDNDNNNNDELMNTIIYQQSIIDKLLKNKKELEKKNDYLEDNNKNYELLLQKHKYKIKEMTIELKK